MKGFFTILFAALIVAPSAALAQARGPITLSVDARDAPKRILHSRLAIPVSPGPLTLVYPKWIPGEHSPTGPITDVVGVKVSTGTSAIAWTRDPVDMYAFHLTVPAGVESIDIALDFLAASASTTTGYSSAASTTPHLAILSWNQLLLYPQTAGTDTVTVRADVRLPAGWKFATALPVTGSRGEQVEFMPVSLTTLVDSPVLAGEYLRIVPLDASKPPVELDIAADSAAALEISPDLTPKLQRLVSEADALFGARHFDSYHFLLTLSDHVAHFGLEHHQSNDSRVYLGAIVDQSPALGVLAHEFVHSWNGKYRRPAGLATPNFEEPMRGDLLWVYEGLTQYLGYLLAARSGLWTNSYYKERLAQVAAYLDHLPGREWRPLVDTATAAQLLYFAAPEWASLRRSTDFYDEGWLIWLAVDTTIRDVTKNRRSIDDFCRLFHGGVTGPPSVNPYTLDDVTAALNQVAAFDWKRMLTNLVSSTGAHAPLDGLTRAGWQVAYTDARNEYLKLVEDGETKRVEAGYSIGVRTKVDGTVLDAIAGLPASRAGVAPGMRILAVNGRRWSPDVLREELRAAKRAPGALTLEIENVDALSAVSLDYHDGLREPHLERETTRPDVLAQIVAPKISAPR